MAKREPLMSPVIIIIGTVMLWSATNPSVQAIPDSVIKIACENMTPIHEGFESENLQHVPCPYRLLVDTIPVVPGNSVNITLTSINGSTPFKGFMIQARDTDGHALGTYLPDCVSRNKSHHMISCSNGKEPYNVVIHSNNKFKVKETFTWIAPITLKGPFKFKYTVVHDFERFWVGEETNEIPVATLSPAEYKIKSSVNHAYYIFKLYTQNCFS